MKKRNFLIIILVCLFLTFITVLITVKLYQNNINKDNNLITTGEVTKEKEVSNILFSNIKYTYNNNITEVSLNITNKNNYKVKISNFIINVYNKKNELIGSFEPFCRYEFNSNETIEFSFSTNQDLSSAYYLEYKLPELEMIK